MSELGDRAKINESISTKLISACWFAMNNAAARHINGEDTSDVLDETISKLVNDEIGELGTAGKWYFGFDNDDAGNKIVTYVSPAGMGTAVYTPIEWLSIRSFIALTLDQATIELNQEIEKYNESVRTGTKYTLPTNITTDGDKRVIGFAQDPVM